MESPGGELVPLLGVPRFGHNMSLGVGPVGWWGFPGLLLGVDSEN